MKMPRKRMSSDGTEYRFKIDAYSPATMPMGRLAEYMVQLAILLGQRESVHFSRLTKGSTNVIARIDREAVPKVRQQVNNVRLGDAPSEPMRAFSTLNRLLRDDNAIGVLRVIEPNGVILKFPGRELAEEKFASVKQIGSIDGTVTGIRGKDDTVHITLESEGRQISGCETTRAIAKQLGTKLYEPVRLYGRGRWSRDADGKWELLGFKIQSFEALNDAPLSTALELLRSIPTEWTDEAYGDLKAIREGPGTKGNGGH